VVLEGEPGQKFTIVVYTGDIKWAITIYRAITI
jgi:hypothetical protein